MIARAFAESDKAALAFATGVVEGTGICKDIVFMICLVTSLTALIFVMGEVGMVVDGTMKGVVELIPPVKLGDENDPGSSSKSKRGRNGIDGARSPKIPFWYFLGEGLRFAR